MRLIDADALILHLSDYQLQEAPAWGANGYGNADKYEAITDCIRAIEEAPTIEPERKTGKWLKKRLSINCSVCKKCNWSLCFEDVVRQFNYCPNCGADMRGEG